MTTTLTNAKVYTVNQKIEGTLQVLEMGGIILYPVDSYWSLGCDAANEKAVAQLQSISESNGFPMEVLVSSIDMLKDSVMHLHPKIETLLTFHRRPLSILFDNARDLAPNLSMQLDKGSVPIGIVQDEYCQTLINCLGRPIVSVVASNVPNYIPAHFGMIRSDVFKHVDHIVNHRRREKMEGMPNVMVALSEKEGGEFLFLRD